MNNQAPRRRKRKKKRYLLRLAIVAAVIAGIVFVMHIEYFAVDEITVSGNDEISTEQIIKLSEIEKGKSVFDVHPFFAQKRIKENLYIRDVNVDRALPNKVTITVVERNHRAQLMMGKKYVVTDNSGMVIEIAKEERKATLIENVTVTAAEKKKTVEVKESSRLNKALELIKITENNDLYFKKISMDGDHVDAYIFDKLVCSGRYSDMVSCIESGNLKAVVYDLYQKGKEKGKITVSSNNYCFFTKK